MLMGRFGEFLLLHRNPSNTCVTPVGSDRLLRCQTRNV